MLLDVANATGDHSLTNAAATDGLRSTTSRISTRSETWIGIRKTLADMRTR